MNLQYIPKDKTIHMKNGEISLSLLKEKTGFVKQGHFVAQLMYFFITRRHSYFLKREP